MRIFVVALLSISVIAAAELSFDVLHYDITMDIQPATQELFSVVAVEFVSLTESLSWLILDVEGIEVDSVWDSEGPLSFEQGTDQISVALRQPMNIGDTLTVWTSSGGHPESNFWWNQPYQGHVSHYSVGMEPYSICHLFPCQDDISDKASFDGHFSVPEPLIALSCGELVSMESKGGRTLTDWHHPQEISMYLWSVVASDFTVYQDSTYSWIKYYSYPDIIGYIQTYFSRVSDMIDCFEELFGQYPWDENLGFPFVYSAGFFEHNTLPMTVAPEDIVAHEIAHHWWGNYVTESSWSEIWLAEGFAVYCEALWEEWAYGPEAYDDFMYEIMSEYVYAHLSDPIVPAADYWGITVYKKGASVIHMLRYVMDDDSVFFGSLRKYLTDNAYGSTTTQDLIEACESVSGTDLNWFFDPWVYGMGLPAYDYGWSAAANGDSFDVSIDLAQVQSTSTIFEMPVQFLLEGSQGKDTLLTMWDDSRIQEETWTVAFQPADIIIDPDHRILRENMPLGVEEETEPDILQPGAIAYPNPCISSVSILWKHHSSFEVTVVDLSGRKVMQEEISSLNAYMDVSSLPAGRYLFIADSGNARTSGTFTVIDSGTR